MPLEIYSEEQPPNQCFLLLVLLSLNIVDQIMYSAQKFANVFHFTESSYNSYRVIHDLAFCLISHDFSLPHFAPSILASWLFLQIANHSHVSGPLHLLFCVLKPVSAWLILCLFMFLLKCHLLSEAFPRNPIYNCIFPVLVSHVPHFPFLVLFIFFHSTQHLLIYYISF